MAKTVEFIVEGNGPFPADMLRYDRCWPADGQAAVELLEPRLQRSVRLRTGQLARDITVDRWSSFGWSVKRDSVRSL